jgi:hypothetical protein
MAKKTEDPAIELKLEILRNARHDAQTYRLGIIIGQVVGGLAFLGGAGLAFAGLSGNVEWLVTGIGFSSKLTNASPGVVFAVAGIIIMWRYKPRMRDNISFDGDGGKVQTAPESTKALPNVVELTRESSESPMRYRDRDTIRYSSER